MRKKYLWVFVPIAFGLGSCAEEGGDVANPNCTPKTCKDLGYNCGTASNMCGGQLNCGKCEPGETCGANGETNRCGVGACFPRSCRDANATCGPVSDGCSSILDCGTCPSGQYCDVRAEGSKCVQSGGTSGSGGSGGTSGSGGSAGNGGIGGSGGSSACDFSDFCQMNGFATGWHCNGNNRVECIAVGSCYKQNSFETCPAGCENDTCKKDCSSICSGRCGALDGCSCGGCPGGSVCNESINQCVGCIDSNTEKQSCTMTPSECGNGTQERQCFSGTWGSWDTCRNSATYVGDGLEHCGDGIMDPAKREGNVLCLKISSTPVNGDFLSATISKFDGKQFDDSASLFIKDQFDETLFQDVGCLPTGGKYSYDFMLDMKKFSLSSPIRLKAYTRALCDNTNGWKGMSQVANVYRCN